MFPMRSFFLINFKKIFLKFILSIKTIRSWFYSLSFCKFTQNLSILNCLYFIDLKTCFTSVMKGQPSWSHGSNSTPEKKILLLKTANHKSKRRLWPLNISSSRSEVLKVKPSFRNLRYRLYRCNQFSHICRYAAMGSNSSSKLTSKCHPHARILIKTVHGTNLSCIIFLNLLQKLLYSSRYKEILQHYTVNLQYCELSV